MSDPTAMQLAREVEVAKAALRTALSDGEARAAYRVKAEARTNDLSDGAMQLALNRLIDSGEVDVQGDCVRLHIPSPDQQASDE